MSVRIYGVFEVRAGKRFNNSDVADMAACSRFATGWLFADLRSGFGKSLREKHGSKFLGE